MVKMPFGGSLGCEDRIRMTLLKMKMKVNINKSQLCASHGAVVRAAAPYVTVERRTGRARRTVSAKIGRASASATAPCEA